LLANFHLVQSPKNQEGDAYHQRKYNEIALPKDEILERAELIAKEEVYLLLHYRML